MLFQIEHINKATRLSVADINQALYSNGYEDKVSSATFAGMNSEGCFVYNCDYYDMDHGQTEQTRIYVHYTDKGKLLADY